MRKSLWATGLALAATAVLGSLGGGLLSGLLSGSDS